MTYAQFFALLAETGLSPERAAKRLGVSNMTLRRWKSRPGTEALAPMHERAFRPVFEEWIAEGLIAGSSSAARPLARERSGSFQGVLDKIGFPRDFLQSGAKDDRALIEGLSKVGDDEGRRRAVDKGTTKIDSFAAMSEEWKVRVFGMLAVIRSKDLLSSDKLVAYGALSYLLMPLDLIPDTIPVVGLLDDFALLGIAYLFYRSRYPKLFAGKKP